MRTRQTQFHRAHGYIISVRNGAAAAAEIRNGAAAPSAAAAQELSRGSSLGPTSLSRVCLFSLIGW